MDETKRLRHQRRTGCDRRGWRLEWSQTTRLWKVTLEDGSVAMLASLTDVKTLASQRLPLSTPTD